MSTVDDASTFENFDFAIMSVFSLLVFDVSAQFGRHQQQLHQQMTATMNVMQKEGKDEEKDDDNQDDDNQDDDKQDDESDDEHDGEWIDNNDQEEEEQQQQLHNGAENNKASSSSLLSWWRATDEKTLTKEVRRASLFAIGLSLTIVIASAIGVAVPSRNLDQRMVYILQGLSLLFSAIVLCVQSISFALLTGVYYRLWDPHYERAIEKPVQAARSLRELTFTVRWSYYRIFTRYFFFLLPFYQGVNAVKIPASILGGVGLGLLHDVVVYLSRRCQSRCRKITSAAFTLLIIAASSVLMAWGVWYIVLVWEGEDYEKKETWETAVFLVTMAVVTTLHLTLWLKGRRQMAADEAMDASTDVNIDDPNNLAASGTSTSPRASAGKDPLSPNRPRMATSLIVSKRKRKKKAKESMTDDEEVEAFAEAVSGEEKLENVGEVEDETAEADEVIGQGGTVGAITDARDDEEGEGGAGFGSGPHYRQMLRASCAPCCGCVRGDDKTMSEKVYSFLSWTVWVILVFGSLYLVLVNIGSTVQQEDARRKLPFVHEALYKFIDEGQVCAFDNKGPASNITTFADKDAAHAEGFLIVHCGACAACSDWHNLRKQYTTRDYLAKETARCARKSLFGGYGAVVDCMREEPVAFQGRCAECWTEDVLCTKNYCAFIFLQSVMINTVSNFQVDADTITSATCEEAHCEARNPGDFVYCSGATRRRMDITSTISRPGAQQCNIVDIADWSVVFSEE